MVRSNASHSIPAGFLQNDNHLLRRLVSVVLVRPLGSSVGAGVTAGMGIRIADDDLTAHRGRVKVALECISTVNRRCERQLTDLARRPPAPAW